MSDFSASWNLSRQRFLDSFKGLNQEQLNWKMQPDALSIAEMALHVAGVEVMFSSQILGLTLSDADSRLKSAATDGVVNDKPFPYSADELTPEFVDGCMDRARQLAGSLIENPTDENRKTELVSALGPVITGEGALARLAFHPAYHQGQAYLIVNSPGFPTS